MSFDNNNTVISTTLKTKFSNFLQGIEDNNVQIDIDYLMNGFSNAQLNDHFNKQALENLSEESINEKSNQVQQMYKNLYNIRIPLVKRIDTLRKKLLVPRANNIQQQEFLYNIFNRTVILNKERNTHPHMMLAQIRRQFEFEVTLEMFPLKIYDIGAGTRSQLYGLSHVYNNQPIMSTADRLRQIKRRRMQQLDPMLHRWRCECDFNNCTHIAHEATSQSFKPDIYLSIDSSYYDGVLDHICKLVSTFDNQAFLAFHVFDTKLVGRQDINVAGTTEGWFQIDRGLLNSSVTMQVFGNPCAYKHKIHKLNHLFNQTTCVYRGCYFAVIKAADFGTSKYLLVQCVKADDGLIKEEASRTEDLHLKPSKVQKPEEQFNKQLVQLITGYDIAAMEQGAYYKLVTGKSVTYYRVVNTKLQSATVLTDDYDAYQLPSLNYKDLVSVVDMNRVVTKLLLKQGAITYNDIVNSYVCIMAGKSVDVQALTSLIVAAVSQARLVMENAIRIMNSEDVQMVNSYKNNEYTLYAGWYVTMCNFLRCAYNFVRYKAIIPVLLTLPAIAISYLLYQFCGTTKMSSHEIETVLKAIVHFWKNQLVQLQQILMPRIFVLAAGGNERHQSSTVVDLAATYLTSLFGRKMINFLSKHFPRRTISTSCVSKDNYKEVSQPLHNGKYQNKDCVQWSMKNDHSLSPQDFLAMNCGEHKPGIVQVMPELTDAEEPIIYHICPATNYCAAKRQVSVVPKCDPEILSRFELWFERVFQVEICPLLEGFSYSVDCWLNHLSAKKQFPMIVIRNLIEDGVDNYDSFATRLTLAGFDASTDYEMFVKSEKQLYSEGKAPKNRCICSPNDAHKYVMGPVCWCLESIFAKFHGYCGGASWDDLEKVYDDWEARGLGLTIQLDGSGFDRTQHQEIKDIVDQRIYKHIASKIHHVPRDVFEYFALARERKVNVKSTYKCFGTTSKTSNGFFKQIGAVFSGSCDTTLMNTLRMALYNRFVCEELCGLQWGSEYEVKSKGDDTVTVLQYNTRVDYVLANYQRVFVYDVPSEEYPNLVHGLGQIAKYFKVGYIEDIDFCSTETVYCPRMGGYKILRQLKRFLTTTVWSRKAKNFKWDQMMIYLESLYQSNLTWMNSIPIYRVFNAYLHKDCTGLVVKTVQGKTKITHEGQDLLTTIDYNVYHEADYKYSLHINKHTRIPHELDMLEYFLRKYGWDPADVYNIERMLTQVDLRTWHIDCPYLSLITH